MAPTLKRKRGKETPREKDLEKRQKTPSADVSEGEDDAEVMGDEDEDEEEEEWGGIGADTPPPSGPSNSGPDKSGKKPKKPPTGEELRAIKDATDLYRSNSFKLQIDALLPNVRPKPSRVPPLERALLSLHTFLTTLPSISAKHPLVAARSTHKRGIAVPYPAPLPTEDTNWTVAFSPPAAEDITLVGSWAAGLGVKAKDGASWGVDLAVGMPEDLFQEKDYLNGRFFHKRAFYLASIAAAIAKKGSGQNYELAYEGDDARRTTLVLRPHNDNSANDFTKLNASIRIIPYLPSLGPIPMHRLSPAHSNLRVTSSTAPTDTPAPADPVPTPHYNAALLLSTTPKAHLLAAHTLKETAPAFGDALALLRVWAAQRGYGTLVRGFEGKGAWWSALLEYLVMGGEEGLGAGAKRRRPVGRGLSSYQLFKAALDFLSKHEFGKVPCFMRNRGGHRYDPQEYVDNHDSVFVDSASPINFLVGVPLSSLDLLRYDAKKTLEALDNPLAKDPFTEAFLKDQRDLPTRFDTIIRVDLSNAKPRSSSLHTTLDHGSAANALLSSLAALLRRGLGDRTTAIGILHAPSGTRPTAQAHPSTPAVIHIGLIHNPEHAYRLVDHGPAADDPDEGFREFWGDKAELRRFKDGRIVESVVWEVKTSDERARVPGMVVQHVLARHFGVAADDVQTWQAAFDSVLRLPESVAQAYADRGIVPGFKPAMASFDQFVKTFKVLDDELPLSLLNVSPASPYLRYTSVFSPVPTSAAALPESLRYSPPMEIVLELEKSSRWPDDLRAIQKIKLAFFERIATVLMASVPGTRAAVVVGDQPGTSEIQDQARLEVVTPQGWAFSARIWHDREANLLDRIINDKPRIPGQKPEDGKARERQEALEAREVYLRRFIHAPRHHRAVAALCHRYSAFAGTVRLVKRWLAAHWLLHGHVSEEVVEIICASLFVSGDQTADARVGVPGSKERGFAAVVEFLKDWAWEDGLFVPLYDSESRAGVDSAPAAGSKHGVWSVSTDVDKGGHMWTSSGPDIVAAHRVRALAKATWNCLRGIGEGGLDVQALFIHPTEDYDFVVHLEPSVLPRYYQNIDPDSAVWAKRGKYANIQDADDSTRPSRPGFDPAMLLFDDIRRTYTDTLKVFYDPLGGDKIGAVWDPSLKTPRPFRVLGGFSSVPLPKESEKAKDKGLVVLNSSSILSELELLGSGLVKEITVRS